MTFELIGVFLVGKHWMGLLGWLRLITDFHCYDVWMLGWDGLTDGELEWMRVAVFDLADLVDGEMVGVEVGVHTHFVGEHC